VSIAFIDTDVIVRFVTGDDPVKMQAMTKLFSAVAAGQQSLLYPVTTIADALYVFTLKRLYRLSPYCRDGAPRAARSSSFSSH